MAAVAAARADSERAARLDGASESIHETIASRPATFERANQWAIHQGFATSSRRRSVASRLAGRSRHEPGGGNRLRPELSYRNLAKPEEELLELIRTWTARISAFGAPPTQRPKPSGICEDKLLRLAENNQSMVIRSSGLDIAAEARDQHQLLSGRLLEYRNLR